MEILTLLLSSLLSLIAPTGLVVDQVVLNTLRSQLVAAETLQVRIDAAPSYQLVQGRANRIRIAGRGLFPLVDVRLAVLELDTDPIQFNPGRLRRGKPELALPLRAGFRLELRQADLERALRSPQVLAQLRKIGINTLKNPGTGQVETYELANPRIDLLDHQRLRLQVELREAKDPTALAVLIETGIEVINGQQIRLVDPLAQLNGESVPKEVLASFKEGVEQQADLRQLESEGMVARILQFQLDQQKLALAGLVDIAPDSPLLGKFRARKK